MADTSDFKNGLCIEFRGEPHSIVNFQHVKPGKGGAFVRTKLKSLKSGKIIDNTFNAGEKIELASVERRPYQYLYRDDDQFHLMHVQTFEQLFLEEKMIENFDLLKEGMQVEVVYDTNTESALTCELPLFVILEVTYVEPSVKGNTASSTVMKAAKLETGAEISVPMFVNQGEKIKVDTRDRSYVERVKE
jgi:elongation factor P